MCPSCHRPCLYTIPFPFIVQSHRTPSPSMELPSATPLRTHGLKALRVVGLVIPHLQHFQHPPFQCCLCGTRDTFSLWGAILALRTSATCDGTSPSAQHKHTLHRTYIHRHVHIHTQNIHTQHIHHTTLQTSLHYRNAHLSVHGTPLSPPRATTAIVIYLLCDYNVCPRLVHHSRLLLGHHRKHTHVNAICARGDDFVGMFASVLCNI